jgi:tetratricopeptide (TPR) repeat protein
MPRVEKVSSGHKFKITKKEVIISVVAVLALALAWYIFLVPSPDKAASDTNQLVIDKNYSAALSELNLAQLKVFSDYDRQILLSGQINVALAQKDYVNATKYLQQQEKYHAGSYEFLASEADLYMMMDNKQLALTKYKQALELVNKQKTGIRTVSPGYLQHMIDTLGK